VADIGQGDDLASGRLSAAEEIIDKQTATELFQGREIVLTTGRVLLHAVGADGRALCDPSARQLAPAGRPWDASYLPHIPRCRACVTASSPGDPPSRACRRDHPDAPARSLPAAGVDVRPVHGTDEEVAGAAALRGVLAEHDLRRWMFTDLVRVDADIRGGFSHPLTISPSLLMRRAASALTTFLHEQLHWLDGPGSNDAAAEASRRWPDPPPPPAGCHDAESSWLHMSVCALAYQSLSEILGPGAAAAELRQHAQYSWVYGQILGDPGWFTGFLRRHGLQVPRQPPVPRRYVGEEWWTNIV
jgi:hypothetical protein